MSDERLCSLGVDHNGPCICPFLCSERGDVDASFPGLLTLFTRSGHIRELIARDGRLTDILSEVCEIHIQAYGKSCRCAQCMRAHLFLFLVLPSFPCHLSPCFLPTRPIWRRSPKMTHREASRTLVRRGSHGYLGLLTSTAWTPPEPFMSLHLRDLCTHLSPS